MQKMQSVKKELAILVGEAKGIAEEQKVCWNRLLFLGLIYIWRPWHRTKYGSPQLRYFYENPYNSEDNIHGNVWYLNENYLYLHKMICWKHEDKHLLLTLMFYVKLVTCQ